MKKKGTLGKVLAVIGALVLIGGAIAAVVHYWDDIKAKWDSWFKKDKFEEFEDFMDDGIDELEDAADDLSDDMEDFVEFEEA